MAERVGVAWNLIGRVNAILAAVLALLTAAALAVPQPAAAQFRVQRPAFGVPPRPQPAPMDICAEYSAFGSPNRLIDQHISCWQRKLRTGKLANDPFYPQLEFVSPDFGEGHGDFGEGVDAADGAGDDGVEGFAGADGSVFAGASEVGGDFGAVVEDGDVGEAQECGGAFEEGGFLAGGFEEGEVEVRHADGEGEAWEAAAAADVDDSGPFGEVREHGDEGDGVEDVAGPGEDGVLDGGEVHRLVDGEEEGEVGAEFGDVGGVEFDADFGGFGDEVVGGDEGLGSGCGEDVLDVVLGAGWLHGER